MHEPDFWTQCAEAMEQTIEGRRLIASEIAGLVSQLWRGVTLKFDGLLHSLDERRHLPPI